MWLTRIFFDLANQDERNYLTIDCSNVNKNGPGRYRTKTDNPDEQVCYFNEPRSDQLYNIFLSNRRKIGNFEKGIYFKIYCVQSKTDRETFTAKRTLEKNGTNSDRLLKRNREQPEASGDERGRGEDRYGKTSKHFLYVRKSVRPTLLSRR